MRFIVLIIILFGGCGYLFGQQLDSLLRCVLVRDAAGGGISGVYMMNKTKHYLLAFSDEKGYCCFDEKLLDDTDSLCFVCLGYEDKIIGRKDLEDKSELRLTEKAYELNEITVESVKPEILLKKASVVLQKRAKAVKDNFNYWGRGQYAKITECYGKAVEYRKIFGVFFTSGNVPQRGVLDERYSWNWIPIYGAQSFSLTASGQEILVPRRIQLNNIYKIEGDYDAGVEKLSELVRSILLYGPLFTKLKYYDFRLVDNADGYTYEFRTKNTNTLNQIRIRCYGTVTIDPSTARVSRLKLEYVDYNMHYFSRRTNWTESPYATQADIRFAYGEDGLPYIEECVQKTVWGKNMKYESGSRPVLGIAPSRRNPAKNRLVEYEFFKADAYRAWPKWYVCDKRFYFLFGRIGSLLGCTKYDENVLDSLPKWPGEVDALQSLDSFRNIKEQFKNQTPRNYYEKSDGVNVVHSTTVIVKTTDADNKTTYDLYGLIEDAFMKENGKRLVIIEDENKWKFKLDIR